MIGRSSLIPPYADPIPAYPGVMGDLVSSTEANLPPLLIRVAIGVASPGNGIALILADRRGLADLDLDRGWLGGRGTPDGDRPRSRRVIPVKEVYASEGDVAAIST